jgi:hypothetical protein
MNGPRFFPDNYAGVRLQAVLAMATDAKAAPFERRPGGLK